MVGGGAVSGLALAAACTCAACARVVLVLAHWAGPRGVAWRGDGFGVILGHLPGPGAQGGGVSCCSPGDWRAVRCDGSRDRSWTGCREMVG